MLWENDRHAGLLHFDVVAVLGQQLLPKAGGEHAGGVAVGLRAENSTGEK